MCVCVLLKIYLNGSSMKNKPINKDKKTEFSESKTEREEGN